MYRENNKGPRTVPWGTPDKTSLFSKAQKRIYPFQCLATNSIAKQFAFKEFMWGCIKCLFKIQYECVNLSSIVQDFSPIIYHRSQLSFTTMSFPECMLPIRLSCAVLQFLSVLFCVLVISCSSAGYTHGPSPLGHFRLFC